MTELVLYGLVLSPRVCSVPAGRSKNEADYCMCCREYNYFALQSLIHILIPLACGLGHNSLLEHVLMVPLLS